MESDTNSYRSEFVPVLCNQRNYPLSLLFIGTLPLSTVINENSSNQGKLFREVKKLLVQKDELSFPSYNDDPELANDIKNFSIQKISKTRSDLDINVVLRPRQDLDADQGRTQDYS